MSNSNSNNMSVNTSGTTNNTPVPNTTSNNAVSQPPSTNQPQFNALPLYAAPSNTPGSNSMQYNIPISTPVMTPSVPIHIYGSTGGYTGMPPTVASPFPSTLLPPNAIAFYPPFALPSSFGYLSQSQFVSPTPVGSYSQHGPYITPSAISNHPPQQSSQTDQSSQFRMPTLLPASRRSSTASITTPDSPPSPTGSEGPTRKRDQNKVSNLKRTESKKQRRRSSGPRDQYGNATWDMDKTIDGTDCYLIISPSPQFGNHTFVKTSAQDPGSQVHYIKIGDQNLAGVRAGDYTSTNPGAGFINLKIGSGSAGGRERVGTQIQNLLMAGRIPVAGTREWFQVTDCTAALQNIFEARAANGTQPMHYPDVKSAADDLGSLIFLPQVAPAPIPIPIPMQIPLVQPSLPVKQPILPVGQYPVPLGQFPVPSGQFPVPVGQHPPQLLQLGADITTTSSTSTISSGHTVSTSSEKPALDSNISEKSSKPTNNASILQKDSNVSSNYATKTVTAPSNTTPDNLVIGDTSNKAPENSGSSTDEKKSK